MACAAAQAARVPSLPRSGRCTKPATISARQPSPWRSPRWSSELPLQELAGFTHRWVDADGIRLHAVEGGRPSGPTVVLLAGFPQTWWAWHKATPRLAKRFRVIAIDLPGQGHSDRPQDGYDTHTLASRAQTALTALDVSKYWLAAHDIGACVAFSLALKYQDRLHAVAGHVRQRRYRPRQTPSLERAVRWSLSTQVTRAPRRRAANRMGRRGYGADPRPPW